MAITSSASEGPSGPDALRAPLRRSLGFKATCARRTITVIRKKRVPYSDTSAIQQLRATNALLKFCVEHNYPEKNPALRSIELCAKALENGDIKTAVEHYLDVPLGGNGCFNDWWPPVVYEYETENYTWAMFEALVSFWSHNMRLSVET